MRYTLFAGLAALGLSGCVGELSSVDEPEVSCATRPDRGCEFDRAPLRVLSTPITIPQRPYQFFPTAEDLRFSDSNGKVWFAPTRTLTDGASIPRIFISIVGDPTSREFINAAAVHDAYCGVGNELGASFHDGEWEDVHLMFYDGLVVGGVEPQRARLMFAAVWLAGPRWSTDRELGHVPVNALQQAMVQTKTFIEVNNPSMPALLDYLKRKERQLLGQYPRDDRKGGREIDFVTPSDDHEPPKEEIEEEYEEEEVQEVVDEEIVDVSPGDTVLDIGTNDGEGDGVPDQQNVIGTNTSAGDGQLAKSGDALKRLLGL